MSSDGLNRSKTSNEGGDWKIGRGKTPRWTTVGNGFNHEKNDSDKNHLFFSSLLNYICAMPDNPHQKIYGLDEAQAFVKENLSTWVYFLQDLANYGSNLIPRCYASSKRTLADTVLIASLLKHVVCMLDGIVI